MDAIAIPRGVLTLKSRVRKLYLSWWATHYAIGLIGVLGGTLLTALTSANGESSATSDTLITFGHLKNYSWLIGIIAAVCTSLVTFLGPIGKAERYWSAYHVLDQACLEYEQGLLSVKKFVTRVRYARTILQAGGNGDDQLNDVIADAERDIRIRSAQSSEKREQ